MNKKEEKALKRVQAEIKKIEKNVNQSTNEITIKKISESNGKIIYEMGTDLQMGESLIPGDRPLYPVEV